MPALDLTRLKTYPLAGRKSKVRRSDFAGVCKKGGSFKQFYDSLPSLLAARSLRAIVEAIVEARHRRKPVLLMMGAHVIKVGLSPLILELIRRDVVTAVAFNGAGIIHDFEIAYAGQTSEDVIEALADGSFGMAEETHRLLNQAICAGHAKGWGLGYAVGAMIAKRKFPNRQFSLLHECYQRKIPATVHVAVGTDIIHQQATADGAAIGATSLADFRRLADTVSRLGGGGVVGNIGSNVILPEVFLKAVSISRNLGHPVRDFTAFDFDMIRHYRPSENVLKRPTALGGQAYHIAGHHELLVPLLVRAVIERLP